MSGFWHPGNDASLCEIAPAAAGGAVAENAEVTPPCGPVIYTFDLEAKHFPNEVFLYWLAAWNACWVQNEQFRARYGFAPWLAFKSPAERDALGEGPGRILTRENEIILPGQDG